MEQHSSDAGPSPGGRQDVNTSTSALSQHARRLQFRRAGFRAAPLPPRRISPLWGASSIGGDPFTGPRSMLKEIQNPTRTPSIVSPNAGKLPNVARQAERTPSPGESRHIEYLEQELARTKASLEAGLSPKEAQRLKAKLRSLTGDNRNLSHEVQDLQYKCDEMTKSCADKQKSAQFGMEERIQDLQLQVQLKDARIRELGWELESSHSSSQRVEYLQAANEELEQRVQSLLEKLVDSPSKPSVSSSVRPQLPRLRTSLPPAPSRDARHSLPSLSEEPAPISRFSTPLPSASTSSSRPLSLISASSLTMNPWDSPTPASGAGRGGRRMRRFGPGSKTLQPLVLPAANSRHSVPASAPLPSSLDMRSDREINTQNVPRSLQPSPVLYSSSRSTSATPQRRSIEEAHSQALLALEGKVPVNEAAHQYDIDIALPEALSEQILYESPKPRWRCDHSPGCSLLAPTDLYREMTQAELKTPELSREGVSRKAIDSRAMTVEEGRSLTAAEPLSSPSPFSFSSCEIPDGRMRRLANRSLRDPLPRTSSTNSRKMVHFEPRAHVRRLKSDGDLDELRDEVIEAGAIKLTVGLEPPSSQESASTQTLRLNNRRLNSETLVEDRLGQIKPAKTIQKGSKSQKNVATSSPSLVPLDASSSRALLQQDASGIFTRLSGLIIQTKLTPALMVRRILSNALSLASGTSLSGMLWWLLGPAYRMRMRGMGSGHSKDEGSNGRRTGRQRLLAGQTDRYSRTTMTAENSTSASSTKTPADHGATWLDSSITQAAKKLPHPLSSPRAQQHTGPAQCISCVEPSTRRTLRLWLQFSLMIMLAVGMAFKHGPEALLEPLSDETASDGGEKKQNETRNHRVIVDEPKVDTQGSHERDSSARPSETETMQRDSGYGSPETLEPPRQE